MDRHRRDRQRKRWRLKLGQIEEISFVDRPANPHTRIMIFKRDDTESHEENPMSACADLQAKANELYEMDGRISKQQAYALAIERYPALAKAVMRAPESRAPMGTTKHEVRKSTNDALAELRCAAGLLMANDAQLTPAQALDAAMVQHPALYKAVRKAERGY